MGFLDLMTTDFLSFVVPAYLAMALFMVLLWAVQLTIKNASVGDVGFCFGLIAVVVWYATQLSGEPQRKWLVGLMVCCYAGRLGSYILFNRVIGKPEDPRYRLLRQQWGRWESIAVFGYFHLQALAVAAFSLPFLVLIHNPLPPFGIWELLGFLLWIAAISGEALADWQLARFRSDPSTRGQVCREGLWYYSRHPNYFFEWLHWWAYVVMAFGVPGWPLAWIGPVAMGWALLKVTGIPLAEEQAVKNRGEEYRDYQRTTNKFFPWRPGSA